jgi:hypothetical protein
VEIMEDTPGMMEDDLEILEDDLCWWKKICSLISNDKEINPIQTGVWETLSGLGGGLNVAKF